MFDLLVSPVTNSPVRGSESETTEEDEEEVIKDLRIRHQSLEDNSLDFNLRAKLS